MAAKKDKANDDSKEVAIPVKDDRDVLGCLQSIAISLERLVDVYSPVGMVGGE